MVVLEGHNMLGVNSPNQYLQPDYLSPLPTTLDAKKSPLALLVQTCSQIGADSPSKSLLHPSPLSSSDSNSSITSNSSSGAGQKRKASTSSDSGHGASLKSLSSDSNDSGRPRSSGSTSSTCSSAKQPRLSHSTSPSSAGHLMVNGKVSPSNHKYSSSAPNHNNNNNNNNESSVISHSSKLRKLSGQSISSECSDKVRPSRNTPSRGSPPSTNSASVVVPHGKTSTGSRSPHNNQTQHEKSSSKSSSENTSSKSTSSPKPSSHHDQGASPIIRSGLDVLQGKDLPKFGGFGAYPPGFDPTNPAFRLPFLAAHHAHLLGYPHGAPGAVPPPGSPYSSLYARSGLKPGEGMMPVCKDPYCTGCQFSGPGSASSASNAFMAAVAAASAAGSGAGPSVCPAGCAQCDHQKFPLIPPSAAAGGPASGPYPSIPGFPPGLSHSALSALGAAYPPSLLSHPHHAAAAAAMMQHQQAAAAVAVAAAAQQQNAQRPYVCNWNSDSYCGKRFASSEELLQHLRTHTSSSAAAASASSSSSSGVEGSSASSAAAAHAAAAFAAHPGLPPPSSSASLFSSALLNSSAMAAAAMHRNYPTPPLSPHSAARYNPYAVAAAAAAAASSGKAPGPLGPLPPPPPALAGYYASPYASLYGPRIG